MPPNHIDGTEETIILGSQHSKFVRGIVAVVALLVFRVLQSVGHHVSDWIQRIVSAVDPELVTLLAVVGSEISEFHLGFIDPVGTSILYLVVFGSVIRAVYPPTLWTAFERPAVARSFRLLISFHVIAVYLAWKFVSAVVFEADVLWLLGEWYGISRPLWIVGGLTGYISLVGPVSVGYLLSRPAGGLRSPPREGHPAFDTSRGFWSEDRTPADIESPADFWVSQGLTYVLPAYGLGVVFIFFDQIFPTIEFILAIGIVARYSPWNRFPPGDVDRYDIEDRLARALRFATANLKGLLTGSAIVGGTIVGGFVPRQLLSLLDLRFVPYPTPIHLWNDIGIVASGITFAIVSTLVWLWLATRFEWSIDDWTTRHDTYDGLPLSPSGDLPPRFVIGLGLPAMWVLVSLWIPFSNALGPRVYAILWPVCALAVVLYWLRSRRVRSPAGTDDNRVIARSIAIQTAVGLLVLLPNRSPTALGVLPTTVDVIFLLGFGVAVMVGTYLIPDVVHRINVIYDDGRDMPGVRFGTQGPQRKARLLFVTAYLITTATCGIIGMAIIFGDVSWPLVYLMVALGGYLAWLYRLDAAMFRPGVEIDLDDTMVVILGFVSSLAVVGFGIVVSFDSVLRLVLPPTFIIVIGIGGLIATGLLFGYTRLVE